MSLSRISILIVLVTLVSSNTLADGAPKKRVVVIGFDGADATLTEQFMTEGKLPNLSRLRDQGAFAPLTTTNPPQTPVSWSSFATGLNPGRTTIFDFLKRAPGSYIPALALVEESSDTFLAGDKNGILGALIGLVAGLVVVGGLVAVKAKRKWIPIAAGLTAGVLAGGAAMKGFERYLPQTIPVAVNNRQGDTLWDVAAAAGLKTKIIRLPATFPATHVDHGEFLSGLGVPDIRGTVGTFSYYTTEELEREEDTEFGGKVVELDPFTEQTSSIVYGPRNKLFYRPDPKTYVDPEGDPREINLPLLIQRTDSGVRLEVSGQTVSLATGEWSDWVVLTFAFNPLIKVKGIARFYLIESEPELKLYLSAINIHPESPPLPISSPTDFAWKLKEKHGWYKTLGWSEDTWSYVEKRIDEKVFLEDVERTVAREREIMVDLLREGDFDLFVQVFTFTDRIAHVFWRLIDPLHPAYDAELAAEYGDTIEKAYIQMDDLVGEAMELAGDDPETLFVVASDHGFATWRRSLNINTWLVKNGYMTLFTDVGGRKLTLEDLFGNKKFWPYVDWSKTKAYALGLGNVYINLSGREPKGIVEPGAEYEEVVAAIKEGFETLVDPTTDEHPVARVYTRDEMYTGFDPDVIPDLRVANNPGYRVSWQSSLGATPAEILEDNDKFWSADHCSMDPAAVPGILFTSQPLERQTPAMVDIMPTILKHLGVTPPTSLDGTPFL